MKRVLFVFAMISLIGVAYAEDIHCIKIDYTDGKKMMQSVNDEVFCAVVINEEAEYDKHFAFWVNVVAYGNTIVFGPENISVKYIDKDGRPNMCGVFSRKVWVDKLNKVANRQYLWFGDTDGMEEAKYAQKNYLAKTSISPDDEKGIFKYVVANNSKFTAMQIHINIGDDTFIYSINKE